MQMIAINFEDGVKSTVAQRTDCEVVVHTPQMFKIQADKEKGGKKFYRFHIPKGGHLIDFRRSVFNQDAAEGIIALNEASGLLPALVTIGAVYEE